MENPKVVFIDQGGQEMGKTIFYVVNAYTRGAGNGHGNGEGMEDPDEATKRLAKEFSFFGDIKNLSKMTHHVCRKGCKYYDPAGDPENGHFMEFCGRSNRTLVERDSVCENYESKVRLSEWVYCLFN